MTISILIQPVVIMVYLLSLYTQPSNSAEVDQSLLNIPEIITLDNLVQDHYLTEHDFLKCFSDGDFKDMTEAASILAKNHFVYSKNFINYLQTVASKIDSPTISEPILENINEELGNYEEQDIQKLTSIGIQEDWYNHIPHKYLSKRFFNALDLDIDTDLNSNSPGATFTKYMLDMYENTNVCESLAIIGFAIEETVSTLYQYIWKGLKEHTSLTGDEIVFFPLHILIDDGHADLLKLGFKHYVEVNGTMCDNAEDIIRSVLDRRVQMFDEVRKDIEETQGYSCKRGYGETEIKQDEEGQNDNRLGIDKGDSQSMGSIEHVQVSVDNAVREAQIQTMKYNVLRNPDWQLLDKMTLAARILGQEGHGKTLAGQITCRTDMENNRDAGNVTMYVNGYGLPLELLTVNDFLHIDANLNVLEGDGFANKATNFHFHVYAKRPDIKCIIHTHPPKASALAMIGQQLVVGMFCLFSIDPFVSFCFLCSVCWLKPSTTITFHCRYKRQYLVCIQDFHEFRE